tara:strand:+ start:1603 stop:1887 length:285 start_codon:yes stop_codon:yes gene_type:complete
VFKDIYHTPINFDFKSNKKVAIKKAKLPIKTFIPAPTNPCIGLVQKISKIDKDIQAETDGIKKLKLIEDYYFTSKQIESESERTINKPTIKRPT